MEIFKGEINENSIIELECAISTGASIRLIPREYKNIDRNYNESLPLLKLAEVKKLELEMFRQNIWI